MNTSQKNVKTLKLWEKFSGESRTVYMPVLWIQDGEYRQGKRAFSVGMNVPKRYRFDLDWQAQLEQENCTFPEKIKESLSGLYNLAIRKDISFFELFLYILNTDLQEPTQH
ncbi:MAG: DUF2610 domain-containing protein [Proteobacteria bacterium]|nr:DUF2610 domain-containing protein [Pseudomonadota bacterium]